MNKSQQNRKFSCEKETDSPKVHVIHVLANKKKRKKRSLVVRSQAPRCDGNRRRCDEVAGGHTVPLRVE